MTGTPLRLPEAPGLAGPKGRHHARFSAGQPARRTLACAALHLGSCVDIGAVKTFLEHA